MASQYPAKIDDNITLPMLTDNSTLVRASVLNQLRDAIIAIEGALGVNPATVYGTVRERLAAIEASLNTVADASVRIGGDIGGTTISPIIIGLRGTSIINIDPEPGQVLAYNGFGWIPTAPDVAAGAFQADGDLDGNNISQTVIGIQGTLVSNTPPGVGDVLVSDGYTWAPGTINSFTASGDLTGTSISQTVIALHGKDLDSSLATLGPVQDGYVLTWVNGSTDWKAKPVAATATVNITGDVTGTTLASVVSKIDGATVPVAGSLTTGNVLQVSGASALTYAPINLAGGVNFVTGSLPTTNQVVQAMGGDVTGTTASSTVAKINATTISTAGGSLTTGKVLRVTGAATADYGAVDLANTSAVTGALPIVNQVVQSMGGDISGTTASAAVNALHSASTSINVAAANAPSAGQALIATDSTHATWQTLTSTVFSAQLYEISFETGLATTTNTLTFVRAGARLLDFTPFPATIGALTRTVKFVCDMDKTTGATNIIAQLYDTTNNVICTGTTLTSTSNSNAQSITAALTVGSSSGNIRNDAPTQYEVQFHMTGGGVSDAVFLSNARLQITYA